MSEKKKQFFDAVLRFSLLACAGDGHVGRYERREEIDILANNRQLCGLSLVATAESPAHHD